MKFRETLAIFAKEKINTYSKKIDSESIYYETIMRDMRDYLRTIVPHENLIIKPSVGQGNYAEIPWIVILSDNPRISPSAQKGIHVVLLFTKDGSAFYLTLGQGITNFNKKGLKPKDKLALINDVVEYFQAEVPQNLMTDYGFSKERINLGENVGHLAKGYTMTGIISKKFIIDGIDEHDFKSSLNALITEYMEIIEYIGNKSYDDVIENIVPSGDLVPSDVALEEIEEILVTEYTGPRDAVSKPINVKKGKARPNKYLAISKPKRYKKTDYLLKAKEDHITGLNGEKIALRLERERVLALDLDPDIYVKHVSDISDSYGYDIESIDRRSGKLVKIFIEVKTTKDIKDTNFFISKNELNVAREKKKQYQILRIYDILSTSPKYYIAEGEVEENFYLDPVTFLAQYKFELTI